MFHLKLARFLYFDVQTVQFYVKQPVFGFREKLRLY
jgi:hypothetical protein